MKWWLFLVGDYSSCLDCKHYVPFPKDRLFDMGRCKVYNVFAEQSRKNESKCGLKARNYTS